MLCSNNNFYIFAEKSKDMKAITQDLKFSGIYCIINIKINIETLINEVMNIIRDNKFNKYMFAPVVVICIVAGLFLINNQTRFKQLDVNTNARRFIWKTALHVIGEKPLLGYGVSDGRKAYVDYSVTDEDFCQYYFSIFFNVTFNYF